MNRTLRIAGMYLVFVLNLGVPSGRARAEGSGAAAVRIPEVHGVSFSGEGVNLPDGLRGKVGVLVVGFSRESRDAVTEWGKRLAADYRESPTVIYYEMPMLAGVPRMLRGFVVGKIKDSVPERARARFVPLMENEADWRALAHYKSGDDAYVIVVDERGVVLWQTHRAFSEAAYGAVKVRVEGLLHPGK